MATETTIRAAFLNHVPAGLREPFARLPAPALAEMLAQTLSTARAAWPEIELEAEPFLSYMAQRLLEDPKAPKDPGGADPARSLAGLAVADLYLACACAGRDARAIAALEGSYFREIDYALRRLHADAATLDDVKQRVREHLFVGETPGIVNYSGSGQLRSWIRVIAVRTLHRLRRREYNEVALENNLIEALPYAGADPELQHIKQHYREAFRAAFAEAMQGLSSTDRVVLRQHFVDGLNIDDLAALHRVHRATAARWLVQARAAIAEQTRKLLIKQAKVPKEDFDSILRLIQSELNLSIRGHLRGP